MTIGRVMAIAPGGEVCRARNAWHIEVYFVDPSWFKSAGLQFKFGTE